MYRVQRTQVPIRDRHGRSWGYLELHLLPGDAAAVPPPLLDRRTDPDLEAGMAGVQLLEGHEYRYVFTLDSGTPQGGVTTDRPEIFRPDDDTGKTGRLRPGLYTGTLPINVFVAGQHLGSFELEVRAKKLDYLSHYRWMLRDLADTFAEVIMRRFAPAEARFTVRPDADAATLYQRFAFLKSMVESAAFEGAVTQILSHPHREWREEQELRPAGQPIPGGPAVARALTRGGPRVPRGAAWQGPRPWAGEPKHASPSSGQPRGLYRGAAALASLPARMPVTRSFETYDTLPNRFVKHVLLQWRNMVAETERALERAGAGAPARRGLTEARGVLAQLDESLAQPLFREVGPLMQSPAGNQVLHKRSGYRDIYRLYVQSEMAAMLAWSGGENVYRAGQKDVAKLYEYWVFIQLARIVSALCREPLPLEQLVEENPDGLDLQLKQGTQRVLRGTVTRRGRDLYLEFWYNRTFARGERHGSWTRSVRPDCSLRIRFPGYQGLDELWLHFDAKYRVESLLEILPDETAAAGDMPEDAEDAASAAAGETGTVAHVEYGDPDAPLPGETVRARPAAGTIRPLTDDLLKMHAYRDAIRRSSGAYVIYPGTEDRVLYRYHEILPGLGAFALRPAGDGTAHGADAISRFIDAVLDHAATQVSQHERWRYWEGEIFREAPPGDRFGPTRAVRFLTRPPADTRVLLGYVRDQRHWRWIHDTGLYNMRADQRTGSVGLGSEQLAAEIVVLYGRELRRASLWRVSGDPLLMTRERMLELGYPDPRSTMYYCLPVEPLARETRAIDGLTYERARELAQELAPGSDYGAPIAATWARLVALLDARTGARG